MNDSQYDAALGLSRSAASSARKVLFDPNMLSLLYFPEEHKYAIYALPFLPIFYQLLMGMKTEWWKRAPKKLKMA
jgi:phosphatidylinositol glycan class S